MATEAIIFDVDGTLLDSVDLHARAWVEAFAHFGYQFDYQRVRSQIGKGGDQLLPAFLSEREIEEKAKDIQEFRSSLFKSKFLKDVKPFPGVRELFLEIRARGQKPALASSAKGEEMEVFKKIAQIEDLVEEQASSADAEKSKPHPDIFEAALKRLGPGVTPDQAVVVGDTPHDAEAATKAGVRVVGVLCGGFAEEDLRKAGCMAIFDGPQDLLRRYDQSPLARLATAKQG